MDDLSSNEDFIENVIDDLEQYSLIGMSRDKINDEKKMALQSIGYPADKMTDAMQKLENYVLASHPSMLRPGTHARWIQLSDPSKEIVKGSMICTTRLNIRDNVVVVFKNYGPYARQFQLEFQSLLLFRRLTNEENILLTAIQHI